MHLELLNFAKRLLELSRKLKVPKWRAPLTLLQPRSDRVPKAAQLVLGEDGAGRGGDNYTLFFFF